MCWLGDGDGVGGGVRLPPRITVNRVVHCADALIGPALKGAPLKFIWGPADNPPVHPRGGRRALIILNSWCSPAGSPGAEGGRAAWDL